jgi:hypothetical protein
MKGVARPATEVSRVRRLLNSGLSDYEVARRTGIPRSTVLNWRRGRGSDALRPKTLADRCGRCGAIHRLAELDRVAYSYLLGQYLGDGCVWRSSRSRTCLLRISSDAQYKGIIAQCCKAILAVRGRPPHVRYHQDQRLATITSYWRGWPCLFPQHGAGQKHRRPIFLAPWQQEIVTAEPKLFLRGLIHSDGWRGTNRVHVKGRDYQYPRYQFSNRSEDIKRMFTETCELLGIEWRPWGRYHISVARRASVALLDEFIGPKW